MGKYYRARTNILSQSGGAVRVTLSSGTGQGNGGTALDCKGCYVSCVTANTEVVKMNIGIAASATVGVDLARNFKDDTNNSAGVANPFFVPVDDVSLLYFYSGDADAIVDIMYLRG